MKASDRPDPALLTDRQLLEELRRRRDARRNGTCDFCGNRADITTPCAEMERHILAVDRVLPHEERASVGVGGRADLDRSTQIRSEATRPPQHPLVAAFDLIEADLLERTVRELAALRVGHRATGLAAVMVKTGELGGAVLNGAGPDRNQLAGLAALALTWARRHEQGVEVSPRARRFLLAAGPAAFTSAAHELRTLAAERPKRGPIMLKRDDAADLCALVEKSLEHVVAAGDPLLLDAIERLRAASAKGGWATGAGILNTLARHLEESALVSGGAVAPASAKVVP